MDTQGIPELVTVDVPELAGFDNLGPGDFIDCLNKAGRWEMAMIATFSDFRTELQVRYTDGEMKYQFSFVCYLHHTAI